MAPLADNAALLPAHIVAAPFAITLGTVLTVNATDADLLHPFKVPVTVYVVEIDGLAIGLAT